MTEYDDGYYASRRMDDFESRFQRYRIGKVMSLHELRPTDEVLDLGCGWGTISFAAGARARTVVGVDFAEESVTRCRERARRAGADNVSFRRADARETGLPSGRFDVVYAADLFEHLRAADSLDVAREAFRCLRPGGVLVVWMPCPSHIFQVMKARDFILREDETHIGYKSMAEMRDILTKAGFGILDARFAESHWPGFNLLERLGQRWIPLLRRRIAIVATATARSSRPGPRSA